MYISVFPKSAFHNMAAISAILSKLVQEVTVPTLAGGFLKFKSHFYCFTMQEVIF